ncbi:SRPBCC family protein [Aquimarina sediminis]|uniref:SRPBCC family protein n=1 Tax=Aquimarina sediminis TaxID=2070536 RepID=UPI000CA00119|nr:SRPBCC family protein [Aquimarina sediminis]
MTTIYLKTLIKAPIDQTFDLARSIDFHIKSSEKTKERAIAGRTSGLIELKETVTWQAKHFGVSCIHKSLITALEYPNNFTDEMIRGHFKTFKHQHIFNKTHSGTEMIDIVEYETPYGVLGRLFDIILLKKYLITFLTTRNQAIKLHLENKN